MSAKYFSKVLSIFFMCTLSPLVNAQDSMTSDSTKSGTSGEPGAIFPFVTYGYAGASAGLAEFDIDCGAGVSCDDDDTAFKVFAGGRIRGNFGVELAYINVGEIERLGGTTEASGVSLSAMGYLPFQERFSAFGKVGVTYGWTETFTGPGFTGGDENSFNFNYGVGVNFEFNEQWNARAEWERYRFEFANGENDVDLLSVGVSYKF